MVHPLVTAYEERRKAAGMRACWIYRRAGVSGATIWHWLNEYHSPNVATVARLEVALDEEIKARSGQMEKTDG